MCMNRGAWLLGLLLLGCSEESPERRVEESKPLSWNFDEMKAGITPIGFQVAETQGEGTPAIWRIIESEDAPSGPYAVAITENPNHGGTFSMLVAEEPFFKDLVVEVRVKAMEGEEDQGGGPVWRYRDADNYYICRWNPLEHNFRLYHVKDGKRRQLASAEVAVNAREWQTIRIEHRGNKIKALLNGAYPLETEDDIFAQAGRVGLWVKADARTAFDGFTVHPQL